MKIDILHVRDPDSACDVRVFIGGVEVAWQDVTLVDIDAGRGFGAEDWAESIAWAEDMPESPFRTAVLEAYGDPPGAKYIDGWDEAAEQARAYSEGRWCGECRYGVVEDPPCCTGNPSG